jgi:MHS family shikimate/dehydroshikimate transporter-like MFS transporter
MSNDDDGTGVGAVNDVDGSENEHKVGPTARRTVIASFVGSTFEWYDFGLYGTVSALVFNKVFFSGVSPVVGTLLALTTTAVGFFTRPIGGIIFGHFGDKIGRKSLLVWTMLLMGIPTLLIGFLPGSATWGTAAPIVLLVLRLIQGIGLGGEYAGAALATIESVPHHRRGFFGSIPQIGNPFGGLLSGAMVLITTTLFPGSEFSSWAWRIPFVVSVILLVYAMIVRLHLVETRDFTRLKETSATARVPIANVFRHHLRPFLLALGARCIDAVAGNIGGAVVLAFVTQYLHMAYNVVPTGNLVEGIIAVPYMLYIGYLGDKFGRRRIFILGLALIGIFTVPHFALLSTKVPVVMWVAILIAGICNRTQFAVQSTYFADVFPVEIRYTAISLVYQLSAIVGGLTPPAAFALLIAAHGKPWPLTFAIMGVSAMSVICAYFLRDRTRDRSPEAVPV